MALTYSTETVAQLPSKPIVIAHRGASGYLPEHTLEAKTLAYAMHPDYIEQDVVMTRDNHLIVLHDHYLDRVTDVATRFSGRARQDGRYYAIDFTLEEIKSLRVTEGFKLDKDGHQTPIYPQRFPMWKSHFSVSTLSEELELIQGLNHTLGYDIGIYPEIKSPAFHRHEGKDISSAVLHILKAYGYQNKSDNIYLQCFDPHELQRIRIKLMPKLGMSLRLIQLIAYTSWRETKIYHKNRVIFYNYDWMFEDDGMKKIAQYADGIAPWKSMLIDSKSTKEKVILTPMMGRAREAGLVVHPYTLRADQGRLLPYTDSFEDMLNLFYYQLKVDGIFTDFPDQAVKFLEDKNDR